MGFTAKNVLRPGHELARREDVVKDGSGGTQTEECEASQGYHAGNPGKLRAARALEEIEMKITGVETRTLRCRWGPEEDGVTRDWSLVMVHTDTGLTGIGRGGRADRIDRFLTPVLIGEDPRRVRWLWEKMSGCVAAGGGKSEVELVDVGALDVALWDLYGKLTAEPVWRLLGGYRDRVSFYADGIGYGDQPPEVVAGLVRKHAELGYGSVKFHLRNPEPEVVLEKVRLSREALGPNRKLMVDVHKMWDRDTAIRMAHAFVPYEVYWIEEPLDPDDLVGHRAVGEAGDAMVAGGEGDGSLEGAQGLLSEGRLDVLQTDILIAGGFTGWMRYAALAERYGANVAPHGASYPELVSHLIAGVPNGLMSPACPETEPYQIWSQLYDPPFRISGGVLPMTEAPGLGLTFDTDFVADHSV